MTDLSTDSYRLVRVGFGNMRTGRRHSFTEHEVSCLAAVTVEKSSDENGQEHRHCPIRHTQLQSPHLEAPMAWRVSCATRYIVETNHKGGTISIMFHMFVQPCLKHQVTPVHVIDDHQ